MSSPCFGCGALVIVCQEKRNRSVGVRERVSELARNKTEGKMAVILKVLLTKNERVSRTRTGWCDRESHGTADRVSSPPTFYYIADKKKEQLLLHELEVCQSFSILLTNRLRSF